MVHYRQNGRGGLHGCVGSKSIAEAVKMLRPKIQSVASARAGLNDFMATCGSVPSTRKSERQKEVPDRMVSRYGPKIGNLRRRE